MNDAKANLSPSFWAGKRVFLTGHTGFKGSWLAEILLSLNAVVRGFALAPETDGVPAGNVALFDELGLSSRLEHRVGDINDRAMLAREMTDFRPEIVLHLAAQPLVRASYRDPVATFMTNVMGTAHVLDTVRDLPSVRAVVIVTSDKCYENREQIWGYRESDPMGGHDPYSCSKGCAELVTSAFRRSYFSEAASGGSGAAICSARAGNVIGGGDWSVDRLLPDVMRAHAAGTPLHIRNPKSVRPWQHVLDPVIGYLVLAQRACKNPNLASQGWNFGPDDALILTVEDVVDRIAALSAGRLEVTKHKEEGAPHEANLLTLDCTAARQRLGWRPLFGADETIRMSCEWYFAGSVEERREIVRNQIALAIAASAP